MKDMMRRLVQEQRKYAGRQEVSVILYPTVFLDLFGNPSRVVQFRRT